MPELTREQMHALLQRLANIAAIRHQIDGPKEEMAARREDLLDCVGLELAKAGYGQNVDAF